MKISKRRAIKQQKLMLRCKEVQNMTDEAFESSQKQLLNCSIMLEDHAWAKFFFGTLCIVPALLLRIPVAQFFFIGALALLWVGGTIQKTMAGNLKKKYRVNKNFRKSLPIDLTEEEIKNFNYGQNKAVEIKAVVEQEQNNQASSENNNDLGV